MTAEITCGVAEKTNRLSGVLRAPGSKSYTQRAIEAASLNGRVRIRNPLYCDDIRSAIRVWRSLGAEIAEGEDGTERYLDIKGFGGNPRPQAAELDVGESGTLLRFVLPVIALAQGSYTVSGNGTLKGRPNGSIVGPLQSWGIDIRGSGDTHGIPIHIQAKGEIRGGKAEVDGRTTSQTVSSLLLAAPFARNIVTIVVQDDLVSKPYVDIAVDVMKHFGVRVEREGHKWFEVKSQTPNPPAEYRIHGDYSSAAFLIAAACLVESDVTVTDLVSDEQGDRAFIDFVRKMGAAVQQTDDAVTIRGPYRLTGIDVDCEDTPDIVPMLATLACFAEGQTRIRNISHLVHKESNRIATTATELNKLGGRVAHTDRDLIVQGTPLHSGEVSSHADHRVAMSLLVAGLKVGSIRVDNVSCTSKSYPNFVRDMNQLGAKIRIT